MFIAAALKNRGESYNRIDVREFPKNLVSTKKMAKLYDRPRLPFLSEADGLRNDFNPFIIGSRLPVATLQSAALLEFQRS